MTSYIDMLTEDNASIQITMTNEQYLRQCDVIAEGALDEAARDLWEIVKAEVCQHWHKMDELADYDCEKARSRQLARYNNMCKRLMAYEVAFKVMGCDLVYETGVAPSDLYPEIVLRKVRLTRGRNVLGCIVDW